MDKRQAFHSSIFNRDPIIARFDGQFRFLDLPPELRNMVHNYAQRTYDLPDYYSPKGPQAPVDGQDVSNYHDLLMVQPNLRQVSKQIKAEVEPLIQGTTTFVFQEHGPDRNEWITPNLFPPFVTANVRHMVFRFYAWCNKGTNFALDEPCDDRCSAYQEVHKNACYAEEIASQFPNLKTCEIGVCIICRGQEGGCWPTIMHVPTLPGGLQELADIKEVPKVEVLMHRQAGEGVWAEWDIGKAWRGSKEEEAEEEAEDGVVGER